MRDLVDRATGEPAADMCATVYHACALFSADIQVANRIRRLFLPFYCYFRFIGVVNIEMNNSF